MRTLLIHISFLLTLASAVPAAWAASNTNDSITVNHAGITYVTRAGDTLSSIALRLTTRQENWVTLSKVNHIGSDTNIPVGTAIQIPADLLVDDPREAKVAALSGSITASSQEGGMLQLAVGARITEGMQIETGNNSFLTLLLPDKSRISLPSNSRVKIAKLRIARFTNSPRTEILLLRGRVESKVAPLEQNKGRFEIHTPLAVAGVRGTQFRVGIGENGTATEVLSGNVEVGPAGKRGALTLQAGQGNIIDAKSVGKPVNLLPAPELIGNPIRQDASSAQFAWSPVSGARAYHLQIANDADGQDIIAEMRSTSPRASLGGLKNGEYFVRLAAIDRLGLEGPASSRAVTLAVPASALSNLPPAPMIDRNETKQLALKWIGLPQQKFTVQIARDSSFSWLVYNATVEGPEIRLPRPDFGSYFARVQAINADGSAGPYSMAQPFVVTDQWIIHDGNPVGTAR